MFFQTYYSGLQPFECYREFDDTSFGLIELKTIVCGAGINGIATALWLKRAGVDVTLIDQQGPAAGASFGNAGVLSLVYGEINIPSLGEIGEVISSRPLNIEAFRKRQN